MFNILHSLLYQIFIILRFIYCSSSGYLLRNRKTECTSDVNEDRTATAEEIQEMSQTPRNTGPGPGDPLLAKQKHHHRRAFEYISKALKIDEENEG